MNILKNKYLMERISLVGLQGILDYFERYFPQEFDSTFNKHYKQYLNINDDNFYNLINDSIRNEFKNYKEFIEYDEFIYNNKFLF
jgi:hypothetical protein